MRFISSVLILFLASSCEDDLQEEKKESYINMGDTINAGCLSSYEINYAGANDTINRTYGNKNIKEGHWIFFGLSNRSDKTSTAPQLANVKLAEGYYKKDKKEGVWKFYKDDGSLKNSIEYKNDVQVAP